MHRRITLALALVLPSATFAQGKVEKLTVHSALYDRDRTVWTYTPAGYDAKKAGGYDLLITFDGDEYHAPEAMGVPHTLDSLAAAEAAPPFVAIMIAHTSNAERTADLGNSARYARFLGEELVPWIRQHYNVTRDPHRTIITGSSAGGLGAAYAALARPDLFGNVLAQSPALWRGAEGSNAPPYEYLTALVARSPKRDVRFLVDVGALETSKVLGGSGPVFIDTNRHFRDALLKKGYSVDYTEVPGGVHAMATWRPRFAPDLVRMLAHPPAR